MGGEQSNSHLVVLPVLIYSCCLKGGQGRGNLKKVCMELCICEQCASTPCPPDRTKKRLVWYSVMKRGALRAFLGAMVYIHTCYPYSCRSVESKKQIPQSVLSYQLI